MFNDIYISTDSLKIGNYVKKLGVKFTFLRPKHLANDFSDTIDVMQHASFILRKLKKIIILMFVVFILQLFLQR